MNKYEFITQLDEYLKGNVSEQERTESVQYYRQYIEDEIRAGRTEEEVLDDLGNPNSIGKSIVEAKGSDSDSREGYGEYGYGQNSYDQSENGGAAQGTTIRQINLSGWKSWLVIAGIILVILFVLSLVFRIFAALIPFLVPFIIVIFVIKLITGRK